MKFLSLFILIVLMAPVPAHARRPAPIVREMDVAGRACLLLDDVAIAMDSPLSRLADSDRVELKLKSRVVQFQVDSDKAMLDGDPVDVGGPVIQDKRGVWVPRSFFTSGPLSKIFQEKINLGPAEEAASPVPAPAPASPAPEKKAVAVAAIPVAPAPAPPGPGAAPDVFPPLEEPEAVGPVEPIKPAKVHAIRRIVVDPGHGGKDPGALGTRGTLEKEVNLWMANELADELRAHDFEVLLTRTDDTFIQLDERAALANKHKADLFISLHCNASPSASLNGFEVYFLSEKASSPRAAEVARSENAVLEMEGKKPSSTVLSVLQSLMRTSHINDSAQLGGIINREVGEQLAKTDLGVKQAAFYVLRGAQMPAVLVELGFLTNRKEEKLLRGNTYRRKLARAIAKSILEFDQKLTQSRKMQG